MKTKKDFLENYSSSPELAKKVLRIGGLTWSEINEMKWDCYDASSGSVPGMIYYADTVPFAKKNHFLILNTLNNFNEETGGTLYPPADDAQNYYNWLAWFAWENTMSEVLSYLEH